MAAPSSQRGFTLLEVLIAFIIAAMAIGVVMGGTLDGLRAQSVAEHYEQGLVRARSRLAAIDRAPLAAGERTGDDGGGYAWSTSVRELGQTVDARTARTLPPGADAPRLTLFAVRVRVSWPGGGRGVELASERLIARPR